MKKTLIQISSFVVGFSLIGMLIYFTSLPSLERYRDRILTPLVTLTVQPLDCFETSCVEILTIEADGETSDGRTLEPEKISTLLELLNEENVSNVEYIGFINPYCSAQGYVNHEVEITLTIDREERRFPLCQIVSLEENKLFSYVVSLFP